MFDFEKDANFVKIVPLVLNSEGGYSNDPADPGGPTKYGIATNYNQIILREMGIFNVKNMTYDQAKQIYYRKYWILPGCNLIPNISLQYIHFDTGVNCGVGAASKMYRSLSKNPSAFEGGGKNKLLFTTLFLEYVALRQRYYTSLRKALVTKYLAGWINRLSDVIKNSFTLG
jgi:hypothetical protein